MMNVNMPTRTQATFVISDVDLGTYCHEAVVCVVSHWGQMDASSGVARDCLLYTSPSPRD